MIRVLLIRHAWRIAGTESSAKTRKRGLAIALARGNSQKPEAQVGVRLDAFEMNNSAIFSCIETLQGDAPYGRVLDAGTGPRSLAWLTKLDLESLTAVTGAKVMAKQVQELLGDRQRPQDRLVIGNWADPKFLAGEQFDTVLAENLLGAIEGFAPYFQTELFARLRPLTAKRLYVVGMEPYVIDRPKDPAGALIWEIGRFRDACLILAGQRHYREFPLSWVLAQLQRSKFEPVAVRKVPIGYKSHFATGQIALCRPGLERMADKALGQALIAHGEELERRALSHIESKGSLANGFFYVIAADPA